MNPVDGRSDVDLLDAWSSGDGSSGKVLYRRYCDALTDFVARRTDHDIADIVQQAFSACLQARRSGTDIALPRAYLYRTVRNALYDQFSAVSRAARVDPAVVSLADLRTGPQTRALRDEAHARLLEALRQIPLDDQLVLELCYWEELPMLEVADVLNIGRSATLSRVHRARGRLRDTLERLGQTAARAETTVDNFEVWREKLRSPHGSPVFGATEGATPPPPEQ